MRLLPAASDTTPRNVAAARARRAAGLCVCLLIALFLPSPHPGYAQQVLSLPKTVSAL